MKLSIASDNDKRRIIDLVEQCPTDGSKTVTISDTEKSATAAQRRLNWMWCGEVAKSGVGQHDDKDDVHLASKWMFARPILLRDDDFFAVVYSAFMDAVKSHSDDFRKQEIREFTDRYISTERMSRKQRAEYLTEFQNYWTRKGVPLTDPSLQGVDLRRYD